MKRTENDRVDFALYAALFEDAVVWDYGLREYLGLDIVRLMNTVENRGVRFLMIDMPEAGKLVDKALSSGQLDVHSLPVTFGRVVDEASREFLRGFFLKLFDGETGRVKDNVDPKAVFFLRQVLYMAKKVKLRCPNEAILHEVKEFARIDGSLRVPSLDWDSDDLYGLSESGERLSFLDSYRPLADLVSERDECPESLLATYGLVAGIVVSQFRQLDWRELYPKHGPGAVADLKRTPQSGGRRGGRAFAIAWRDKYSFPFWPEKLDRTFPFVFYGQSREDMHLGDEPADPINHELPARLIAVPKTLKGPRMIASEPVAHQYIQLGLMRWIREHLPYPLRLSIDFRDQEPSRQLCLRASKDGKLATVDLSAASDRLSCWVVERAFWVHPQLLSALHAARTRSVVNATGVGEKYYLRLKKYAPMGNGTTFPVQSIVYALAAYAACIWSIGVEPTKVSSKLINRWAGKVRVFGDDIILPSHARPALESLLTHLQLKVNDSKTHHPTELMPEGRPTFRESCGMDAYGGEQVTPVYLGAFSPGKAANDLVSWVDVCNNFHVRGLWFTGEYLFGVLPQEIRDLIPSSSTKLGCITLLRLSPSISEAKHTRFNRALQRTEVFGLVPVTEETRMRRVTHRNLLQYFVEDPSPKNEWRAGVVVQNRLKLKRRWVAFE